MCLPAAIRVAYSKAKIGFVFSRRGIIMEAVSSFFLPKLIGTSRAVHLTTTGAVYPAEHPLFGTLFSETLPSPQATLSRALELADEVAKNTSTISTKLMRDLMYRAPTTAEEAHLLDSRVIYGLFGSKDNTEVSCQVLKWHSRRTNDRRVSNRSSRSGHRTSQDNSQKMHHQRGRGGLRSIRENQRKVDIPPSYRAPSCF